MDINDDKSGTTNNGSKSRFFERLKKISLAKRRKGYLKEPPLKEKKDNRVFFKPFLVASAFFVGAVKNDNKKQNVKKNVSNKENDTIKNGSLSNFSDVKKQKQSFIEKTENINLKVNNISNDNRVPKLQLEILNLIKKRLVKNINELEILHSELYILKEITGDTLYLEDCQEKIKEIKKLLSKVKNLKEKYDYLKDNTSFDYLLEIGDDALVDKIIELKEICSSDEIKNTIDNYKILEEYKYLYLKIDRLEEDIIKYNDYKLKKEEELKKRDIDFNKIKSEVSIKEHDKESYDNFVREQDLFLKKLNEQISKIDSREVITYKLKGFNELVRNSFKYIGLLLASPLKGILPGIVTETIATKNVIRNLYNNLELDTEKKMVYEAIDFSLEINSAINDLDRTLNLVDTTLDDIVRLKNKYQQDFSKYQYSITEYSEIIKKINKMENAVINNKIKIEFMQEKMREKEKQNRDKMEKVKKLNCS